MTEPQSPAQTATEAPIPSQYPAVPGWSAAPGTARPKRSRGGLIAALVLVVVLIMCGGIAGTAIYVSNRQYGVGAPTPADAVNAYLTGVYLHQEADEAQAALCQQADPILLAKRKVNEARAETERYDSVYSWSTPRITSTTDSSATIATRLTAQGVHRLTTADLTLTTIESDGWWVCGVKSSGN
jgi:hypothetical protein